MKDEEKIISDCFTYDLYNHIEFEGKEMKPYLNMIKNLDEVERILLGKTIRVNGKSYIPRRFNVQTLEADTMIELFEGIMSFGGAAYIKDFNIPLALFIKTKNFKVYDMSAANMGSGEFPDNFELLIIDNNKLVSTINTSHKTKYKGVI